MRLSLWSVARGFNNVTDGTHTTNILKCMVLDLNGLGYLRSDEITIFAPVKAKHMVDESSVLYINIDVM